MPNRIIKESICTSDSVDGLSWYEESFFYRLIVNCDDFGRMDARPPILRSRLFPLKSVTDKQIESALQSLRSAGIVDLYVVDGRPFLQIRTWEKHQQVRAKKSKFPAPDENLISNDINRNQPIANVPVIQSESLSKSESLSIQQLQQSAHEGAREDAPTKHEVTMYFVSIVRDVGQAMNEANKFYAYNALRNWDCLPDWKATADLWCARIPDHMPQDVGEDSDDAAFLVALTKTE